MTDLLIIGAGTAGLTAAIYGARGGLSVEVLERSIYGGQIITTSSVENYPGMPGVSGVDFAIALHRQVQSLGIEIVSADVVASDLTGDVKQVTTPKEEKQAKTVIIATGALPRKLQCPGEEPLAGHGVSYCATCDGAFHKGKDVAVIGGGNTAIEDALVLSSLCRTVYLIHRSDQFRAEKHTLDLLRQRKNVQWIPHAVVSEIHGTNRVEAISVAEKQGTSFQKLDVSGVFIAIGAAPDNTAFEGQIDMNAQGYIIAGEDCHTNQPGVFVAGDTRTKKVRQIVTAAADGAVAALAAAAYITEHAG